MIRRVTVLVLATFAAAAPAASATTLRTLGGATVAPGSSFGGALKSGTTFHWEGGSAGDYDCTSSSLAGTIGTNPGIPSATAQVSSFTLGSCTDTIPFTTISTVTTDVTAASPKTATATYTGAASPLTIERFAITLTYSSGSWCTYETTAPAAAAQHNSLASPPNAEYTFTSVDTTKTGGNGLICPSSMSWSATYVLAAGASGMTIQP